MKPEMNINIQVRDGMKMEEKNKKVDEIIKHMEEKHGDKYILKFDIVFC